jgi:gamma-glutamyl-gamma-aminobutyraldehyde dehydrogenase
VIAHVPACGAADVDRAVRAADDVHHSGIWADRSPRERAAVLLRLADLMETGRGVARVPGQSAGWQADQRMPDQ